MRNVLSKISLAAVLILGCQFSALASVTALGEISGTTTLATTTITGSFLDLYNFSIAKGNAAAFVSTSIAMPTYGTTVETLNVYAGTFSNALGLPSAVSLPFLTAITESQGTKFITLSSTASLDPGAYTLVISGKALGDSAYTGIIALTNLPPSTPPVPEPETYAMLLAGLGMLGFIARRRQNIK